MKKVSLSIVLCLVGCIGTNSGNPMIKEDDYQEDIWWRTPYRSDTPRESNPWVLFVKQRPNPLAEWTLSVTQSSVSPTASAITVTPSSRIYTSSLIDGPASDDGSLTDELDKNLQDYWKDYLRRRREDRDFRGFRRVHYIH